MSAFAAAYARRNAARITQGISFDLSTQGPNAKVAVHVKHSAKTKPPSSWNGQVGFVLVSRVRKLRTDKVCAVPGALPQASIENAPLALWDRRPGRSLVISLGVSRRFRPSAMSRAPTSRLAALGNEVEDAWVGREFVGTVLPATARVLRTTRAVGVDECLLHVSSEVVAPERNICRKLLDEANSFDLGILIAEGSPKTFSTLTVNRHLIMRTGALTSQLQ